ncbi:hypothetical protein [Microbulbifer taiwanensis]|uniref:hypothetical protein n=1 Tax=Microbulbifer taiwanensis TaxID=986746 RepID=UPI003619E165
MRYIFLLMLVLLINISSARSSASENAILAQGNHGGGGRMFVFNSDLDLSDNEYDNGESAQDSISSVYVEPGYELLLCSATNLRGRCGVFIGDVDQVFQKVDAIKELDNKASSYRLLSSNSIWKSFEYSHNYPHAKDASRVLQGVAFDKESWYFIDEYDIYKVPFSDDISNYESEKYSISPERNGCDHLGDGEHFAGTLFVAVEKCPGETGSNRIFAYDGGKYNNPRMGILASQVDAPWVAINPVGGLMFSSDFDNVNKLFVYDRNFSNGENLVPLYTIDLDLELNTGVQGGAFSPDGLLYLSVDDKGEHGRNAGIHVYRIKSDNTAEKIRFIHPNGFDPGPEEVEGITVFNVNGKGLKGVTICH